MRRFTLALAPALVVTALVVASPAQAAPASKTLIFKTDLTSAGTVLETLPGDITYGWNDLRGLTRWGKQGASVRFLASVNYASGTGPFGGPVTITRADGSKLALSVSGWATSPSDQAGTANTTLRGTVTVVGGSRKYAGATGTGTVEGYRKAALGGQIRFTFSVTVQQRRK